MSALRDDEIQQILDMTPSPLFDAITAACQGFENRAVRRELFLLLSVLVIMDADDPPEAEGYVEGLAINMRRLIGQSWHVVKQMAALGREAESATRQ